MSHTTTKKKLSHGDNLASDKFLSAADKFIYLLQKTQKDKYYLLPGKIYLLFPSDNLFFWVLSWLLLLLFF
jgi:hypothetical protein